MSKPINYKVVPDSMRTQPPYSRGTRMGPKLVALLEGKTILVEGFSTSGSALGGSARYILKAKGYKLHSHQVPEGVVLWLTKEEKETK